MSFTHLHCHSEFSILDGYSKIADIPRIAKANGDEAVAITEHGSMASSLRFWKAGKEHEIKTIMGKESYVTPEMNVKDKDSPIWHLVLIAKNKTGLNNLFALSHIGWTEGFYRKPRVDYGALRRHSEGL